MSADRALNDGPGARLTVDPVVSLILGAHGVVGKIAHGLLGDGARPVRALVFDKTEQSNWAVAWHQDRTIVVRERGDAPGFGPWSMKQGLLHVAPPVDILACMVTLRLHLDPCGEDNAPLTVALGSHRFGKVAAVEAAVRAFECPRLTCLADVGDVWAYSTLILHTSMRALAPLRRRVLQIDYAGTDLPYSLSWRGIAEEHAA